MSSFALGMNRGDGVRVGTLGEPLHALYDLLPPTSRGYGLKPLRGRGMDVKHESF